MSERRLRFDEWMAKVLLSAVAVWLLAESTLYAMDPDPINIGKRAETLGIIGILAAVIVILVVALVLVYRGKEEAARRREERLEKLVELTAGHIATSAETQREQAGILVEFKRAIDRCNSRG
jgi:beta-lactamase regulating signal transducer with metallopeptidase domain